MIYGFLYRYISLGKKNIPSTLLYEIAVFASLAGVLRKMISIMSGRSRNICIE